MVSISLSVRGIFEEWWEKLECEVGSKDNVIFQEAPQGTEDKILMLEGDNRIKRRIFKATREGLYAG